MVEKLPPGPLTEQDKADLAAGFQAAVVESIADRVKRALREFRGSAFVVAGGVAANSALRARLTALATDAGLPFVAPPPRLCTDNAAMIAWAGLEHLRLGRTDPLDTRPRPRWPLDPDAPKSRGAGAVKA